jgi:hypothetical protein
MLMLLLCRSYGCSSGKQVYLRTLPSLPLHLLLPLGLVLVTLLSLLMLLYFTLFLSVNLIPLLHSQSFPLLHLFKPFSPFMFLNLSLSYILLCVILPIMTILNNTALLSTLLLSIHNLCCNH